MQDLQSFQELQRELVNANFESTLDARREGNQAVFSLLVKLDEQTPERMARLAEITTDRNFAFTVENGSAAISARKA
jgi:hypothetical protein